MKKLEKYIPTIKFNKQAYIIIIILFVLLLGGLKRQKDAGIKIGNTMILMSNYNTPVEISEEDQTTYEAEVLKNDELINAFALDTGKNLGNRTDTELERFLTKAENLNRLGNHNAAIKSLIAAFKYYPNSPWILDALASTYAQAWAYKYALRNYQKIIEILPESKMMYAKTIIEMYIEMKEVDIAGKQYIEYIKNGWEEDKEIINKIRMLRWLPLM